MGGEGSSAPIPGGMSRVSSGPLPDWSKSFMMRMDRRATVALLGSHANARGALAKIRPALGTAEIHFRIAADPRLQIGSEVQLEIHRAVDQTAHQTEARVLSCDLHTDRAVYFFRLPSGVASVLGMLFNQREAVRVVPAPGEPVRVQVRIGDGGRTIPAVVDDISQTGLGVLFGVNQESRLLACGNRLDLLLELPDTEPMEIVGDPRHRRLMGASIRYGIPFLPDETEDFESKRLKVYRYVHCRQIEMIEALRTISA